MSLSPSDIEFLKLARMHPELPFAKPAGIVRRFPAFLTDLSLCFWIIAVCLTPIAERFRNRFLEIVQIRSIAFAIDAGLAAPSEIANAMNGALRETLVDIQEMNVVFASAFAIVSLSLLFLYFFLFEASPFGATPGKIAFGLKVVDERLNSLSIYRAFLRQAAQVFTFLSAGAGPVLMLSSRSKRALHDWISRTRVISFRSNGKKLYRICASTMMLGSAIAAGFDIYQKAAVVFHWAEVTRIAATRLGEMSN